LVEKAFLHLLKTGLYQDFLQLAHYLVKPIIVRIVVPLITNLKIFILSEQ
jgi:hypothetical protein